MDYFDVYVLISMIAVRVRVMQSCLYVDTVRDLLIHSDMALRAFQRDFHWACRNGSLKSHVAGYLLDMKRIYSIVWQIGNRVGDCFGWSNLAIIIQKFIHVIDTGSWVYRISNMSSLDYLAFGGCFGTLKTEAISKRNLWSLQSC